MSRTYKATGINLKGMPIGESDRILTVLTREFGLIRAVAPGARKHESSLRGRSGLFVVNQLLIAKGRNLDKIIQAESVDAYTGLSQDLRKLTAGQYLAELVLHQALSHQPQEDLFALFNEQLRWLEQLPTSAILPYLSYAMFRLLALAGVAPQVHQCCVTQQTISPDVMDLNWQAGFHPALGGVVTIAALERLKAQPSPSESSTQTVDYGQIISHFQDLTENGEENIERNIEAIASASPAFGGGRESPTLTKGRSAASLVSEKKSGYRVRPSRQNFSELGVPITALELAVLQQLPEANLIQPDGSVPWSLTLEKALPFEVWISVERILRQYAQYHFDRSIQSATLVDTCFSASSYSSPVN